MSLLRILFFLLFPTLLSAQSWQPLLTPDLSNFTQLDGEATYRYENGELIGISKMNTPNSFLATKAKYSDFILEFEVWIENGLNSGVQFRSHQIEGVSGGRVHGYQAEIETSDRRWAGGIYDESRRGWLYPLSYNPKGQTAFVTGGWNHYRIEAIGHQLRTWVNGIQCAHLVDDLTAEGFIAFQVHGISDVAQEGKQVRWRNVRILTREPEGERKITDPDVREVSYLEEKLTENERRKGWRMLLDKSKPVPRHYVPSPIYGNYELVFDFKCHEGGQGGIQYLSNGAHGLRFQIIDDANHTDANAGVGGNRTTGALYDLLPPENLSERSNPNKRYSGGYWSRAQIIVNGSEVEHWLNGIKVVSYNRHSQAFRALVAKSKYAEQADFGQQATGAIRFENEEGRIEFRNIKIREF